MKTLLIKMTYRAMRNACAMKYTHVYDLIKLDVTTDTDT